MKLFKKIIWKDAFKELPKVSPTSMKQGCLNISDEIYMWDGHYIYYGSYRQKEKDTWWFDENSDYPVENVIAWIYCNELKTK